jgi:AbrB family looped-hinge helix DNA binding protein
MPIVKMHPKGQVIIPKDIRDQLGIRPGKALSIERVGEHIEIRPLPDDPIEYLTGIFEGEPGSMASELLEERKKDNEIDEANVL